MKTLKAGVIGLGVGEQHVLTYQSLDGVEVTDVCDIDAEKLREVGDRRDIANRHQDYRRVTENPDIDIVSVCSYDDSHVEHVTSAFQNGKHVFVEKPVALDRPGAEAVLRAQQDSGRYISSNLVLRSEPRFIELKKMIDAGELGEIVSIEGDYLHEILWKITEGWRGKMDFYCVAYGGGIHLIDLMRWLIGQEVVEICGMSNKILTRGSDYKYDDVTVNLMKFEQGTLGKSMSNFGPQRTKFHSLNVYGTRKTFINDRPHAKLFDGDQPENEHVIETPYPMHRKGDLLPAFVEAVRAGHEPEVSATDVFRVLDVCLAAWDSIQAQRTIPVSYMI